MKFIWEVSDVDGKSNNWGLMATCCEELVIIGGKRVTSLRDGHSWEYATYEKMIQEFNQYNYIPVLAPINPSVIIRQAEKNSFNYGDGLIKGMTL